MSTMQQFCLRWNNHQPNFISVFSSLLNSESLVDVTLAAEGRHLQAHKVVLSACSSYFQSLFTINPCQHPIVILKDVKFIDLKVMVDFMYYGEVNVSQEQLPHILKTAEMLKIKGLAEMPDSTSLTKSQSSSTERAELLTPGDSNWSSDAQRRSLSPSPCPLSPSSRRKRLRKSSTGSGSGSTERTSEEHPNETHITSPSGGVLSTHIKPDPGYVSECSTPLRIPKQHSSDSEPHRDSSQESIEANTPHQITLQIPQQSEINVVQNVEQPPVNMGPSTSTACSQPPVSGLQWAFLEHSCHPRFALPSHHTNMPITPDVQYTMADASLPMTTASCSVNAENAQTQTTTSTGSCNTLNQSIKPCTSPTPMMTPGGHMISSVPMKRKRSINPQADENFVKALEAVRFGGIGFCKAARMYGVNNRTLWLEYKKRGYPISRLSIKSRIKIESEQEQDQQQHQQQTNHGQNDNQQQMIHHNSNGHNNINHSQPVICQPPHSVAMIGATFPADFSPNLQRSYQDTSIMAATSSHITVPCTVNFSQI